MSWRIEQLTRDQQPCPSDPSSGVLSHVNCLLKLHQAELKATVTDLGRTTSIALENIFRVFVEHYSSPDIQLSIDRIVSNYSELKDTFEQKLKSICEENETPHEEELFLSIDSVLDELKESSTNMMCTIESSLARVEKNRETAEKEAEEKEKEAKASAKPHPEPQASTGLFSKLSSIFKKDEQQYLKADLGKEGSGMRYDPVKKKWIFEDDDQPEAEEPEKKLPPKAGEKPKKPEESVAADKTPVSDLLKPRSRNLTSRSGGTKEKNPEAKSLRPAVLPRLELLDHSTNGELEAVPLKRQEIIDSIQRALGSADLQTGRRETDLQASTAEILKELSDLPNKIHKAQSLLKAHRSHDYDCYPVDAGVQTEHELAIRTDSEYHRCVIDICHAEIANMIEACASVIKMATERAGLASGAQADSSQNAITSADTNPTLMLLALVDRLIGAVAVLKKSNKNYYHKLHQFKGLSESIYANYRSKVDTLKHMEGEMLKMALLFHRCEKELEVKKKESFILKHCYRKAKASADHYKAECETLALANKKISEVYVLQKKQARVMLGKLEDSHESFEKRSFMLSTIEESKEKLEEENLVLRRCLTDAESEAKLAKQSLDRLMTEYQTLTDKYYDAIHKSNKMIDNIQDEKESYLKSIKAEKDRLVLELDHSAQLLSKKQLLLDDANREACTLRYNIEQREKVVLERESDLQEYKEKLKNAKELIKAGEKETEDLKKLNKQLQFKIEDMTEAARKAHHDLQTALSNQSSLNSRVGELSIGLEQKTTALKTLKAELELLRSKTESAQSNEHETPPLAVLKAKPKAHLTQSKPQPQSDPDSGYLFAQPETFGKQIRDKQFEGVKKELELKTQEIRDLKSELDKLKESRGLELETKTTDASTSHITFTKGNNPFKKPVKQTLKKAFVGSINHLDSPASTDIVNQDAVPQLSQPHGLDATPDMSAAYMDKLGNLQSENKSLQSLLGSLREQQQRDSQTIKALDSEKSELQRELSVLKAGCEEKDARILELTESLKQQSAKAHLLETSMKDSSQQFELQQRLHETKSTEYQQQLTALQSELGEAQIELKKTQERLQAVEQQIAEKDPDLVEQLQTKTADLEEQLKSAVKELAKYSQQSKIALQKEREIVQEIVSLKILNEDLLHDKESLEHLKTRLEQELEDTKRKQAEDMEDLELELKQSKEMIGHLQSLAEEHSIYQPESADPLASDAALKELTLKLEESRNKIESLELELQAKSTPEPQLQTQDMPPHGDIESREREIAELREVNDRCLGSYQELQSRAQVLERNLGSLEEQMRKVEAENTSYKQQVDANRENIRQLETEVQELKQFQAPDPNTASLQAPLDAASSTGPLQEKVSELALSLEQSQQELREATSSNQRAISRLQELESESDACRQREAASARKLAECLEENKRLQAKEELKSEKVLKGKIQSLEAENSSHKRLIDNLNSKLQGMEERQSEYREKIEALVCEKEEKEVRGMGHSQQIRELHEQVAQQKRQIELLLMDLNEKRLDTASDARVDRTGSAGSWKPASDELPDPKVGPAQNPIAQKPALPSEAQFIVQGDFGANSDPQPGPNPAPETAPQRNFFKDIAGFFSSDK